MGVFLGWMPDAATQAALAAFQQQVRDALPPGSPRHDWRLPAHWHMTVRYLGDHPGDAQLGAIDHAIRGLPRPAMPLAGTFDGLVHWPDANVLVVRIDPGDALDCFFAQVEAAMQACAFPAMQAQTPHVTLAYLLGSQPAPPRPPPPSPHTLVMRQLDLLRSVPGGYASLASWPLAA